VKLYKPVSTKINFKQAGNQAQNLTSEIAVVEFLAGAAGMQ
jgi:hypothetical protein